MKQNFILIIGVTASGKGKLAFELAKYTGGEIVSIDSMKVYRRMDIGTAKPPKDARTIVPYHLIDIVEPSEPFSVGLFLKLANEAIDDISKKGKPIVAVGGTALYIKALLYGLFEGPSANEQIRIELKNQAQQQGLESLHRELQNVDPDTAARISSNDEKRIIRALEVYKITGQPISAFQNQWAGEQVNRNLSAVRVADWTIIGLRRKKEEENARINKRVKIMIDSGLLDEVKSLLREQKPLSKQARCAIGYAEIIDYLNGKSRFDEAVELIKKHSPLLAKHQRTWFKRFDSVHWLDIADDETIENIIPKTISILGDI
jgi:tRNA dimethylallyltransferase